MYIVCYCFPGVSEVLYGCGLCRFRQSPSWTRHSVANVVVDMCLKLGAPEVAVEIITDPRLYGIFPSLKSMGKLMEPFSKIGDVESEWVHVPTSGTWYVCVFVLG